MQTRLAMIVPGGVQVERKRHIGNDIINIIFVDGDRTDMARFKPLFIKSQAAGSISIESFNSDVSSVVDW